MQSIPAHLPLRIASAHIVLSREELQLQDDALCEHDGTAF
jgi:hypothetical protein